MLFTMSISRRIRLLSPLTGSSNRKRLGYGASVIGRSICINRTRALRHEHIRRRVESSKKAGKIKISETAGRVNRRALRNSAQLFRTFVSTLSPSRARGWRRTGCAATLAASRHPTLRISGVENYLSKELKRGNVPNHSLNVAAEDRAVPGSGRSGGT